MLRIKAGFLTLMLESFSCESSFYIIVSVSTYVCFGLFLSLAFCVYEVDISLLS